MIYIYGRISLAQKKIYIRGQSQAQKERINATNREVIKKINSWAYIIPGSLPHKKTIIY